MPAKSPDPQSEQEDARNFVGRRLLCPGDVFHSPGETFSGTVIGTPKSKARSRSRCFVQFDGDSTEYWFPVKDVAGWVVDKNRDSQSAQESVSKLTTSASDSDFADGSDPSKQTSDAAHTPPADSEQGPNRASDRTVLVGAEYGIPLASTLAMLILAGLIWFCAQLWASEKKLTVGSSQMIL